VRKRVGLEPRGFWCHSGREKFQSDIDRANELALTGWLIIYVTWEDLVRRPEKILSPAGGRPRLVHHVVNHACVVHARLVGPYRV
jgi:hypothetical protein